MISGMNIQEKKSWEKWWRTVIRHNGTLSPTGFERKISLDGKSVLDVGCGNLINEFYKDTEPSAFVGVDISQRALSLGKKILPRVQVALSNAAHLPFRDRSFDIVVSTNLLFYLGRDFEKSLMEMARVSDKSLVVTLAHSEKLDYLKGYKRTFGGWKIYKGDFVGVDEDKIVDFLGRIGYEANHLAIALSRSQVTTSVENGVVKYKETPLKKEVKSEIYIEAIRR